MNFVRRIFPQLARLALLLGLVGCCSCDSRAGAQSNRRYGSTSGASSGGLTLPSLFVSPVDYASASGSTFMTQNTLDNAGNETNGVGFYLTGTATRTCTGVRTYWQRAATATLKASIWDPASPATPVATVTAAVTGRGIATFKFASSVQLTPYKPYIAAIYDTAGASGHYTSFSSNAAFWPGTGTGAAPFVAGPYVVITWLNHYESGDLSPTQIGATERYPIEPVVQ